jgi:choline dehydrogenase-like flavoprotein
LNEVTSLSNNLVTQYTQQNPQSYLPADVDSTVLAGYKAEREVLAKYIKLGKVAMAEFIGGTGAGMVLVLLKPFSRGSITIKSTSAFDDPVVDFATMRNPIDLAIFTEMIKAWRNLLLTPSLQKMGPTPTTPPSNITSDADIKAFLKDNLQSSLWHPSGSAPMLKKELGGVVGTDLLVYGTKKLSIIDSSILPVCPSTHITSTMYAVAEKVCYFSSPSAIFLY